MTESNAPTDGQGCSNRKSWVLGYGFNDVVRGAVGLGFSEVDCNGIDG